jgi:endoglucanase
MKIIFPLYLFFISSTLSAGKLFVNQAGYLPSYPKIVYYNAPADSFYVVEVSTGTTFYSSSLQLKSSPDVSTGMIIYYGDFSSLQREGIYFIRTSTNETSPQFKISSDVYKDIFRKTLRAFYFQRCGTPLLAAFAGAYNHPGCHLNDADFHSSTGHTGYHLSTRGWHDAGDYGKYIVNAGISAGTMLFAYEEFPERFSADDLNIPESGNNIPDILDEIKYEIDWFLSMQDQSGGVFFKLTPEQFESFVMPAQATAQRFIYELSTTASGNFAAVMARFSRLYKPYDSLFAAKCLTSAVKAWNYLSLQSGIVPPGGFHNPPGTATGVYGDNNDSDERLWAAAELFETTGNTDYKDYFDFNYNLSGVLNSTMWWGNVRTLAHLTYLRSTQTSAAGSIKDVLSNSLNSYCNQILGKVNSNAFAVSISPGEYNWGSNSTVLNNAIILIYGYEMSWNTLFRNAALDQLNYILGVNGTGYSFVTGIGQKRVLNPHHRPSKADGITEPIPGLMAGGPNEYLQDPVLQQNFNSSTPPALCYIDDWGSYASNEVAINWNSPLVFVSGYFNTTHPASLEEEKIYTPIENKLNQNFPNPFNPETRINYILKEKGNIRIRVLNTIGEEIAILTNGEKESGEHYINFNAEGLPAGIYFCQLIEKASIETIKMVLLK